jgi:predicted dehydrogenase
VNLDEARPLADYATKKSGQTAVPFVYRYYPLVREMREHIVGNGQPGMLIRGSYLQDWLADPTPPTGVSMMRTVKLHERLPISACMSAS